MPPQSPSPEYDFIYKDRPQPKKGFGLPGLGLPRPVKIILGISIALIVIILFYSLLFGNKTTGSDQLVGIMGRAQEIARVSDLVQKQSKDTNTLNLATTAEISMASDQAQLTSYLKKNHQKFSSGQLLIYKDSNIDTQLQSAAQNNSVESFYISYLKKELGTYHSSLVSAFAGTGPNAKAILQSSDTSVETLLSTSQLKSPS